MGAPERRIRYAAVGGSMVITDIHVRASYLEGVRIRGGDIGEGRVSRGSGENLVRRGDLCVVGAGLMNAINSRLEMGSPVFLDGSEVGSFETLDRLRCASIWRSLRA